MCLSGLCGKGRAGVRGAFCDLLGVGSGTSGRNYLPY